MIVHQTPLAERQTIPPLSRKLATTTLVVACVVGLAACSPKENAATESAPVVKGESIQFAADDTSLKSITTAKVAGPTEREITVPGRLVWDEDRTVRIFTPFSGRVEKIVVDVGARVAAGQPLAYLQSPDFAAAQSDVRKADASLRVARSALARVKELAANGIVATKDLHQAEADFASADAESRRASARLQLYGQRGDAMGADQRFAITSPIAGVVVERNLNPGQELRVDQPSSPQYVVTDPTKLWVQLDASEADLKYFKSGMPVLISSPQYPDDIFRGELTQVSDFIDPVARSLKLRAKVSNADRRLKSEMFVNARIALPKDDFVSVPDKAVYLEGMRNFVFLKVAEGKFVRTPVRAGLASGGVVPIQSGLKAGDEVVVGGSLFLQQSVSSAQLRSDATAKDTPGKDAAKPVAAKP
jgi:cobalt-zinc-cadmium efflux system membrane fusion protein